MADKKPESKPASKEEMAEAAELMDFAAGATAAAGVAEVAEGMDTLEAAADVADVGKAALVGLPGIEEVTRGFKDSREINTVTYNAEQITKQDIIEALKAAGTYSGQAE